MKVYRKWIQKLCLPIVTKFKNKKISIMKFNISDYDNVY